MLKTKQRHFGYINLRSKIMSSFNEDFKNLMDNFYKAGLGNSYLPTFARGDDYNLGTVTEVLLTRINGAIQNTSDAKKKKALQDVAAQTVTPYLQQNHKSLTPDMQASLSKIYETNNLVFVSQNEAFKKTLDSPKSTWENDFGCLREEMSGLTSHEFPADTGDMEHNCRLLLSRLSDGKHGMRDADKINRINALSVKAVEIYLHKSGKTAAELPDFFKKQMTDILGKDAKIVSDTPDKKMRFDLSACIAKEPEAKKIEKKPSFLSRLKAKATKIWEKPSVKAATYTALAVGFGAATAGIMTLASSATIAGAYGAASVGNAVILGMACTTAGCGASLFAAGYKIKQAFQECREKRLQKENSAAKREKTILTFRDRVEQLQKEGNVASSVFEVIKLDEQLKALTVEENQKRGVKGKEAQGLNMPEYNWVKNFYPKEFQPILANTLKLSRMGVSESEIKAKTAQASEKAKADYSARVEKEKNQGSSRKYQAPQKGDWKHRLVRTFRQKTSGGLG